LMIVPNALADTAGILIFDTSTGRLLKEIPVGLSRWRSGSPPTARRRTCPVAWMPPWTYSTSTRPLRRTSRLPRASRWPTAPPARRSSPAPSTS
jgi:hypothetical protein